MRSKNTKCNVCHIEKKKNPNGTLFADGPVKWRRGKGVDFCSTPCQQEAAMLRKFDAKLARN